MRARRGGEPAHDVDQLSVRVGGWIVEFGFRVGIGELAEVDKLADPLSPVQLQLGRSIGEENPPPLTVANK